MPAPDDLVNTAPGTASEAAARLEAALDRIARCAARAEQNRAKAHGAPDAKPADGATAEVAAKLDSLISQLRNALSSAE